MSPEQVLEVIQLGKDVIFAIGALGGVIVGCCFWLLMKGVK